MEARRQAKPRRKQQQQPRSVSFHDDDYDEGDDMDGFSAGGGGMFGGGGMYDEDDDYYGANYGGSGGREDSDVIVQRTPDITEKLYVTLDQLHAGDTLERNVSRIIVCRSCEGSGAVPDAIATLCSKCTGKGKFKVTQTMYGMDREVDVDCEVCDGSGCTFRDEDRCNICNGVKTVNKIMVRLIYSVCYIVAAFV